MARSLDEIEPELAAAERHFQKLRDEFQTALDRLTEKRNAAMARDKPVSE